MSQIVNKQAVRNAIIDLYLESGCEAHDKNAGAVNYTTLGLRGSPQRIGAVYGSRGGGASLWIKEDVFQQVKPELNPDEVRIEDVDLTRRGFQWAFHFDDPNDPIIELVVRTSIELGLVRWEKTLKRREDEKRRAEKRAIKEAEMAQRKRNPFA